MAVNAAALERALSQGITARRTSQRCWMASSASGRGEYEVIVDGAAVRCRCTAGLHGRACKHAELVRVLDASGAVPIPERRVSETDTALAAAILGGED
jgi:hypothetical protein